MTLLELKKKLKNKKSKATLSGGFLIKLILTHNRIKIMANYYNSAKLGKQLVFKFIEERRKEKGISQLELSEMIGINESTLIRNFKDDTEISFSTILKICGALEIRPFFVPAEIDQTEFQRMFFS